MTQNKEFRFYARHKDLKEAIHGTMYADGWGSVMLKIMEQLRDKGITDQSEPPERVVISKA